MKDENILELSKTDSEDAVPVEERDIEVVVTLIVEDIETLAVTEPEKIIKESIDMRYGLMPFQASQVAYSLGLPDDISKQLKKLFLQFKHPQQFPLKT